MLLAIIFLVWTYTTNCMESSQEKHFKALETIGIFEKDPEKLFSDARLFLRLTIHANAINNNLDKKSWVDALDAYDVICYSACCKIKVIKALEYCVANGNHTNISALPNNHALAPTIFKNTLRYLQAQERASGLAIYDVLPPSELLRTAITTIIARYFSFEKTPSLVDEMMNILIQSERNRIVFHEICHALMADALKSDPKDLVKSIAYNGALSGGITIHTIGGDPNTLIAIAGAIGEILKKHATTQPQDQQPKIDFLAFKNIYGSNSGDVERATLGILETIADEYYARHQTHIPTETLIESALTAINALCQFAYDVMFALILFSQEKITTMTSKLEEHQNPSIASKIDPISFLSLKSPELHLPIWARKKISEIIKEFTIYQHKHTIPPDKELFSLKPLILKNYPQHLPPGRIMQSALLKAEGKRQKQAHARANKRWWQLWK